MCSPWSSLMFTSVQFSFSVVPASLQPHGLQHARLPCLLPTPRTCSNSCPLNWWYHPTISSSVIPFSCLQSSLASGSFPISQFFSSGGQSIGACLLFYGFWRVDRWSLRGACLGSKARKCVRISPHFRLTCLHISPSIVMSSSLWPHGL